MRTHHPVDFYFAKHIAPQASEAGIAFLAKLLAAAREGRASLPKEEGLCLPAVLFEEALVEAEGKIYLRRNWECLQQLHAQLDARYQAAPQPPLTLPGTSIENTQTHAALEKLSAHSLSLVTGGPGTGKTYQARLLITALLPLLPGTLLVTAPTGKATANLRRALAPLIDEHPRLFVQTLHSLLYNHTPRLATADLLLIDEASMVDNALMTTLLTRLKKGARLLLIGDPDQLPPIESGACFADLVASKPDRVTTLSHCYRTELQPILALAAAVKGGEAIMAPPLPAKQALIEAALAENAAILTPLRKGPWGVQALNDMLLLEDQRRGSLSFPIMITVNDKNSDLYNGDIGRLYPAEGYARFGERTLPLSRLPEYRYAYALSIHKSQGSEYDHVVILLPEGSEVFGRELLYTAITRAKKTVSLYAAPGVLPQILTPNTICQK